MAKTESHKLKLLYVKKILEEQTDSEHPISTEEIISALAEYGIPAERKSIYRDLAALEEFGLIIERTSGRDTRYYLDSGEFELPELKLLVDAVQSSRFITQKKSNELIAKLEKLASPSQAKALQRQVYVNGRVKTDNETIYYAVDCIHRAIAENVQISFQYFDWNTKKEKVLRHEGQIYTVSPFALSWDDEKYYLISFDSASQTIKHYRVDKMLRVKLSDVRREGHEQFSQFDMAVYARQTFGMFGGENITVRLDCAAELASVIIDRFGEDVTFIPSGDRFTVAVSVKPSPVFYGWITEFGGRILPISPEHTVSEYRAFLQKNLDAVTP